jgi:hypothetical protein
MKFKMWVEIKQLIGDTWVISFCVHDAQIYDPKFFIEGYRINKWQEDGKFWEKQTFKFNPKLFKEIQKLLFPNEKRNNYISLPKQKAWDFHHFLYYEGFRDAVHPCSRSGDFLRDEFEGTQQEIYQVCLNVHNNWIKPKNNEK